MTKLVMKKGKAANATSELLVEKIRSQAPQMKSKAHKLLVASPLLPLSPRVVQKMRQQRMLSRLHNQRLRIEVMTLEYKRTLKAVKGEKIPQKAVAEKLGISQPAVAKSMKNARDVPDVLPNRIAATPFEVCQKYAAGLVKRDVLISELVRWTYSPTPMADEHGDYKGGISGTFDEVTVAKRMGLLDGKTYAEIVARITAS